jgi:TetR/AcrR family transcriptional regulator of autoinduction and epiphytic fitness
MSTDDTTTDGRRLRRDNNRRAVVDALLNLFQEGNLSPSTEEIAARSGVSSRSLFRYFDDVDDLARAAILAEFHRVRHLTPVAARPDQPLATRLSELATQRSVLWEAVGPVAMVSRMRAHKNPTIAESLRTNRRLAREQVAGVIGPELAAAGPHGDQLLALADVLTSFETWRLLRDDQSLSVDASRVAILEGLTRLFPDR